MTCLRCGYRLTNQDELFCAECWKTKQRKLVPVPETTQEFCERLFRPLDFPSLGAYVPIQDKEK